MAQYEKPRGSRAPYPVVKAPSLNPVFAIGRYWRILYDANLVWLQLSWHAGFTEGLNFPCSLDKDLYPLAVVVYLCRKIK